jgi:uncharacterized membrane protein YraQ (UPF0718 family)
MNVIWPVLVVFFAVVFGAIVAFAAGYSKRMAEQKRQIALDLGFAPVQGSPLHIAARLARIHHCSPDKVRLRQVYERTIDSCTVYLLDVMRITTDEDESDADETSAE